MSPWRSSTAGVGLDAQALAHDGRVLPRAEDRWTAAGLEQALAAAALPPGCRRLRMLVAPDLCRHFVLDPPLGLARFDELRELAAVRAAQLYGSEPLEVAADWQLGGPFACAVLPASLRAALQAAARGLRLALAVESAALAGLQQAAAHAAGGFVGWAMPGHAVAALVDGARVLALRCARRPGGQAEEEAQAMAALEARQESLRLGRDAAPLRWLGRRHAADDCDAAWAARLAAGTLELRP